MKTAKYVLELHSLGGPYIRYEFTGTRREARIEAKRITPKLEGCKIHFIRYVNA